MIRYDNTELIDKAILKMAVLSDWLIKARNSPCVVDEIGELESQKVYYDSYEISVIIYSLLRAGKTVDAQDV